MGRKKASPPLRVNPEVCETVCTMYKLAVMKKAEGMHNDKYYLVKHIARLVSGDVSTCRKILQSYHELNQSENWVAVHEQYRIITNAKDAGTKDEIKSLVLPRILPAEDYVEESQPAVNRASPKKNGKLTIKKPKDVIEIPNPEASIGRAKTSSLEPKYWEDHGDKLGVIMPLSDWEKIHSMIMVMMDDRDEYSLSGMEDGLSARLKDILVEYSWKDTETNRISAKYNLRYDSTNDELRSGKFYYAPDIVEAAMEKRTTQFTEQEMKDIERRDKSNFDVMNDLAQEMINNNINSTRIKGEENG